MVTMRFLLTQQRTLSLHYRNTNFLRLVGRSRVSRTIWTWSNADYSVGSCIKTTFSVSLDVTWLLPRCFITWWWGVSLGDACTNYSARRFAPTWHWMGYPISSQGVFEQHLVWSSWIPKIPKPPWGSKDQKAKKCWDSARGSMIPWRAWMTDWAGLLFHRPLTVEQNYRMSCVFLSYDALDWFS